MEESVLTLRRTLWSIQKTGTWRPGNKIEVIAALKGRSAVERGRCVQLTGGLEVTHDEIMEIVSGVVRLFKVQYKLTMYIVLLLSMGLAKAFPTYFSLPASSTSKRFNSFSLIQRGEETLVVAQPIEAMRNSPIITPFNFPYSGPRGFTNQMIVVYNTFETEAVSSLGMYRAKKKGKDPPNWIPTGFERDQQSYPGIFRAMVGLATEMSRSSISSAKKQ